MPIGPRLAALAGVVCLVLLLAHLSSQIRVETILQRVRSEAESTIDRNLDRRGRGPRPAEQVPAVSSTAVPVLVGETGFLSNVDEEDPLHAVVDAEAFLLVEGSPGGSLVAGTPLGRCWGIGGQLLPVHVRKGLTERVEGAMQVGPERTAAQDIAFGLRQLTGVADTALSPGIDDPATAVHALGHVSGVLCHALDFELGPRLLRDEQGRVRVVLQRPDFSGLLDSAIAQPRRFGSDSPDVLVRVAQLLHEVGWKAPDEATKEAVREQAHRLGESVASGDLAKAEVAELKDALQRVDHAVARRW